MKPNQKSGWVPCSEAMPVINGDKPKLFVIALELVDPFIGEHIRVSTVALYSNKEKQEGNAYTPKGKFYWGPDIYENPIAWRELPEPPSPDEIPYQEIKTPDMMRNPLT